MNLHIRNLLLAAGVAASLGAVSAGVYAVAAAEAGASHFAGQLSMKADEGVPHDMVTALKADEGVPHNLVAGHVPGDEGVPQNLVAGHVPGDEGVPQNLVAGLVPGDEGVPQNLVA